MESEGKTREELIREVEQLRAEVDRLRKALAEQGHAQQDMRALSHADELTGLYNRGTFFTLGLQQLSLAERNRTPLLLLYCRLQGWEQIRSTHGIPASEEALGLLTGAMRETFRQSDLAANLPAFAQRGLRPVGPAEPVLRPPAAGAGRGSAARRPAGPVGPSPDALPPSAPRRTH
ncbi:MAG: GGDEF domain-containing protein [Planctomycetota bacterium]